LTKPHNPGAPLPAAGGLMTRGAPANGSHNPGAPLPAALAASTGYVLSKAAQRAVETFEAALRPLGIRSRHYGVLTLLVEDGPLSQQVLGERLRVDRTTMVAVVDDLERLGLAERRRDPADRRAYAIHPKPAGEETLTRARTLLAEAEEAIFAPLSAAERRQLRDLLVRLV
jgi:DNA-binding MarR family transcriptional regulator